MKIAIVTPGRAHLLDCAKEFIKYGHDVTFYTMVSPGRCNRFGLPRKNVVSFFAFCAPLMFLFRKIRFPGDFNRRIYYWVCRLVDILTTFRLRECDVIVSISGCSLYAIKKAKKKFNAQILIDRGARHILSQKEILSQIPSAQQVYQPDIRVELEQYKIADKIIVPSKHVKESFMEYDFSPSKLFSNPYGVNLRMFQPIPNADKQYDVIFVGNWTLQKGVDILTKACELSRLSLLHVGAIGDFSFPTGSLFKHLDPVNQDELTYYYNQAKVLALPSRQDGFGLVLFQAMACGLPLVYSHMTGGPDLKSLVQHKEYLFETEDMTAECLSRTLVSAVEKSKGLKDTHSYLSEKDLNEITWEAYGDRYNEFLKSIGF